MFKFIKENFLKGVEEAKEEQAEEQAKELAKAKQTLEEIEQLPKEEIFGSSLSAPFRAAIFNDWFTLFRSSKESLDESYIPLHLFTFGNLEQLEKDQVELLHKQKEISWDVSNEREVMDTGKTLLMSMGINLKSLSEESVDDDWLEDIAEENTKTIEAWGVGAFASLIIAGVEFHEVPKEKALEIFKELQPYVSESYANWQEYAEAFLIQDKMMNLNKGKRLENTTNYLTYKYGSPWVRYPLEMYKD